MKKLSAITKAIMCLVAATAVFTGCSISKGNNDGYRKNENISGSCGDNLTYDYVAKTGKLTIKGYGEMTSCPWSGYGGVVVKSVEFEEGITSLYHGAFYAQSDLEGEIVLPSSLTYIDDFSFYGTSKVDSIKFSDSTTYLGDYAFRNCGIKGELNLPDSVTYIGEECFEGCINLTGPLKLPNSLSEIGRVAFSGCEGLTGDLVIPDSVSFIGDYAFSKCSGLNGKLKLSNNLTEISNNTFAYIEGFKGDLVIPESVMIIGESAFSGTGFDGKLVLPKSMLSIGSGAFQNCAFINGSVVIPDGIIRIEESVFAGCKSISSVTFNDGLKYICNSAFANCTGLIGELNLPDKLVGIGGCAFIDCAGLGGKLNIPESVEIIEASAFEGCMGFNGELLLPDNITAICSRAFYDCSGINGKVIIPDSVYYIGVKAFSGCSKIEGIVLGKNVTSIDGGAFEKCGALKSVEFTNEEWIPDYYIEEADYNRTVTFPEQCKLIMADGTSKSIRDIWKEKTDNSTTSVAGSNQDVESDVYGEDGEVPYFWTDGLKYNNFIGVGITSDTVLYFDDNEIAISINGREPALFRYFADSNSEEQNIQINNVYYKYGHLSDFSYAGGYKCSFIKAVFTDEEGNCEDVYFLQDMAHEASEIYLRISLEDDIQ